VIEIKSRSNPDKVLCRKIELRDFNRIRLDVSDEEVLRPSSST